jgi:hypothetical protein
MTLDEWTKHRADIQGRLNGHLIILAAAETEEDRKWSENEVERLRVCLRAWDRDKAQVTSGPTPDFVKLVRVVYGLKN